MLIQSLVAGAVSICNIAVHALVMTAVVHATRSLKLKGDHQPSLFLTGTMIVIVSILMMAHASEVIIWALAYAVLHAAPPGTNFIYFAFVNYTTLGYGDVVPIPEWQLLGPVAAMNGILLFGWSTAVIFEVLRKTMVLTALQVDKPAP